MKIKDLRAKDLDELRALQGKLQAELPKLILEEKARADKNVKKVSNKKRELAVITGMVRARELGEAK